MKIDGSRPNTNLANGLFDAGIVCQECEGLFDPYDAYALRFFRNLKKVELTPYSDQYSYRVIPDYDRKKLKLFFLSILWRTHATSLEGFHQVNLGPYEKK